MEETAENESQAPNPPNALAEASAPDSQKELQKSVTKLLSSDLQIASKDYELLKKLNDTACVKYQEMAAVTKTLSVHVEDVKSKYKSFEPYLAKVEEICDAVAKIEQTVALLDDYTMRLVKKKTTKGKKKTDSLFL
jgi:uncharacterized protein YoxC